MQTLLGCGITALADDAPAGPPVNSLVSGSTFYAPLSSGLAATNGPTPLTWQGGGFPSYVGGRLHVTTGHYLSLPATAALSFPSNGSFTIRFQILWNAIGGSASAVAKGRTTGAYIDYEYTLYQSVSNSFRFVVSDGASYTAVFSQEFMENGVLYDVIAYYDAARGKIGVQINGGRAVEAACTHGSQQTDGDLLVGKDCYSGAGAALQADVRGLALWNRILTDREKSDLRNRSNGAVPLGRDHPFADPPLAVTEPWPYQVFQRTAGGTTGTVHVSGTVGAGLTKTVEARWQGGAYQTVATGATGDFTGTMTGQSQGQGTLDVRFQGDDSSLVSIPYVGVGDVFIIAGQSNASGRGTNLQSYTTSGPKSALFGNDYYWRELVDPTDDIRLQTDVVSDEVNEASGSVWPLVATSYLSATGIPCAFIPCALGGTAIVAGAGPVLWTVPPDHQDRTTLYGSLVYRATQARGARLILWWQGEAEASTTYVTVTESQYRTALTTLANAWFADLGVKTMPCKLQNCTGTQFGNQGTVNTAVGNCWAAGGSFATGPDLSGISTTADTVDGVHLISDSELSSAATAWAAAIQAAL